MERAPVRFSSDIRKQVRVVIEARTGYNGNMPPIALQNDAEYPIDVTWQDPEGFSLPQNIFDSVTVEDLRHAKKS